MTFRCQLVEVLLEIRAIIYKIEECCLHSTVLFWNIVLQNALNAFSFSLKTHHSALGFRVGC